MTQRVLRRPFQVSSALYLCQGLQESSYESCMPRQDINTLRASGSKHRLTCLTPG